MVDDCGRLRILDFGLAKVALGVTAQQPAATDAPPNTITERGAVIGTISYMSPEQLDGGTVDERSDLYSATVVLYELLTGRRPFEGGSTAATISAILRDEPLPPRDIRREISEPLSSLLLRGLSKLPSERPSSCHELAQQLAALRVALDQPPCHVPFGTASGESQAVAHAQDAYDARDFERAIGILQGVDRKRPLDGDGLQLLSDAAYWSGQFELEFQDPRACLFLLPRGWATHRRRQDRDAHRGRSSPQRPAGHQQRLAPAHRATARRDPRVRRARLARAAEGDDCARARPAGDRAGARGAGAPDRQRLRATTIWRP